MLDDLAQLGGVPFIDDLLASFEEDSARALRDVERALAAGDYAQWQHQVHMLKGGARDVGANRLADCCADAERVKAFELASGVAQEKLALLREALSLARAALSVYQTTRRLRAEHN